MSIPISAIDETTCGPRLPGHREGTEARLPSTSHLDDLAEGSTYRLSDPLGDHPPDYTGRVPLDDPSISCSDLTDEERLHQDPIICECAEIGRASCRARV